MVLFKSQIILTDSLFYCRFPHQFWFQWNSWRKRLINHWFNKWKVSPTLWSPPPWEDWPILADISLKYPSGIPCHDSILNWKESEFAVNGFTSTLELMQEMNLKDSWIITMTVSLPVSPSLPSLHELHSWKISDRLRRNISLQRSVCYGLLPALSRHLNGEARTGTSQTQGYCFGTKYRSPRRTGLR